MANKFDESKYHLLETYIENGSSIGLDNNEIEYLEVLSKMNTMRRKYGKEKTIKYFISAPHSISPYRAKQMFDEAINLFYSSEKVDKKAMRALKAEQLEKAADLILATARNSADIEVYIKAIVASSVMRQLDKIDPPEIPAELYTKPIKIYSLDPEKLKLPKADRNRLAKSIDNLDVPEPDKNRFKQEAGIEDVDFIEMIDEQSKKDKFQ